MLVTIMFVIMLSVGGYCYTNHLDSSVYMIAIRAKAEKLGTAAAKLHNSQWPLSDGMIRFSQEDISTNALPLPYPGTITDLNNVLEEWLKTYDVPCIAAGAITAPFNYVIFKKNANTVTEMLNVNLCVDEANERNKTVIETSPDGTSNRLVQRHDSVFVEYTSPTGSKHFAEITNEDASYCLQLYYPVIRVCSTTTAATTT